MASPRVRRAGPCTVARGGGGLFLLIALLYIGFLLRLGSFDDAVVEPLEPPLCLLTSGPALVVALPLLEPTAAAASSALTERLENWQSVPPCHRAYGAATLSLVLAWSGAALVDAQAAGSQLQRRAVDLLRPVRHCLGEPELLDGRAIRAHMQPRRRIGAARRRAAPARVGAAATSTVAASTAIISTGSAPAARLRLPANGTLRENALFLAVLAYARRRGAALLWLSPHTTPLRPRWLEATPALAPALDPALAPAFSTRSPDHCSRPLSLALALAIAPAPDPATSLGLGLRPSP